MRESLAAAGARSNGRNVGRGLRLHANCGSGARAFSEFVPDLTGQNDGRRANRAHHARHTYHRHIDQIHRNRTRRRHSRNCTCGRHARNRARRYSRNRARCQNAPGGCASADRCAGRTDGPKNRSTGFREHGRSNCPTLP